MCLSSKTFVLFLGSLYLLIISTVVASSKNCPRFKMLDVNFTIAYSSSKKFQIQFRNQCFSLCEAENTCIAVVSNKKWKEEIGFCEILLLDGNDAYTKQFGHSNTSTTQGIWVNSNATTTMAQTTTILTTEIMAPLTTPVGCPPDFTLTGEGYCFLVGNVLSVWDEAQSFCQSLGGNIHLSEIDSNDVNIVVWKSWLFPRAQSSFRARC